MNILIMGLPGSGKGTQSDLIVEKYNIKHLSTGNLFRKEIQQKTSLGEELNSYISTGNLVPDELTIRLLKEEINKPEYNNGFLLDGFPRTLNQAIELDKMLSEKEIKIDHILYLDIDEEVIVERLSNRIFCPTCQRTYHRLNNPSKLGEFCEDDNTKLIQREDDQEEKIKNRIEIAKKELKPILDFYQKQNLSIIKTEKTDSVEMIFSKIKEILND